ncbi:MAG: MBL fold metallo-hydrolase [Clostridia bacterium]|nr:MBL fold metallo-hydrolase [Clostridia bacterium]
MKITWIGQAGLLFETDKVKIIVDPYLSDSVFKVNPANYRRVPVDERFLAIEPDYLLFTHDHLDHYDPETAPVYLERAHKMTVLCPESVWGEARKHGGVHNYVCFDRGTVWTADGLRFTAVKATHSDFSAIGIIIEDLSDGRKYYITGDTLYNHGIFSDLPDDLYAIFLPINGVGNNMNATDAAEFAKRSGAKYAVPIHFGMFDQLSPEAFQCENRVIPEIYKEIKLG